MHLSTILCVIPSFIFFALDNRSLSSAPPSKTMLVSALIRSRMSSRSSARVCVAFSPTTNRVGVFISNKGSSGSPLMPSKVWIGNPRHMQALMPPVVLPPTGLLVLLAALTLFRLGVLLLAFGFILGGGTVAPPSRSPSIGGMPGAGLDRA